VIGNILIGHKFENAVRGPAVYSLSIVRRKNLGSLYYPAPDLLAPRVRKGAYG
jgi:hypothetical protein